MHRAAHSIVNSAKVTERRAKLGRAWARKDQLHWVHKRLEPSRSRPALVGPTRVHTPKLAMRASTARRAERRRRATSHCQAVWHRHPRSTRSRRVERRQARGMTASRSLAAPMQLLWQPQSRRFLPRAASRLVYSSSTCEGPHFKFVVLSFRRSITAYRN